MRGTVARRLRREAYRLSMLPQNRGLSNQPETMIGKLIFKLGDPGKFFRRQRVGTKAIYRDLKKAYRHGGSA